MVEENLHLLSLVLLKVNLTISWWERIRKDIVSIRSCCKYMCPKSVSTFPSGEIWASKVLSKICFF